MVRLDSGDGGLVDPFVAMRHRMVKEQIVARGVRDGRVLAAMERVPRHLFVDSGDVDAAHGDHPLSIGCGQTISQPYIVALMIEALALRTGARVLEIGTGCGYATAILAELGCEVYSIEIVPTLADSARERLAELGFGRVHTRCADGSTGWPEAAPFNGIIVAAAPAQVPPALFDQLAQAGRLVIPVGEDHQALWVYERARDEFRGEQVCEVRFVRMTGAVK